MPFAQAWERLAAYRAITDGEGQLHYRTLGLNLAQPSDAQTALLAQLLADKATLVLGPSGSGKSTLINLLIPQAQAATGKSRKRSTRAATPPPPPPGTGWMARGAAP